MSPSLQGHLLLRNLLKAIPQARQARIDFKAFDESLRRDIPEEAMDMEAALDAWEKDKSQPDPYKLPRASKLSMSNLRVEILIVDTDISLSDARLKLAEEEKAQIEAGNAPSHGVGATGFVLLGVEIQKFQ